ncbi:MAG: hypothetical protein IJ552_02930 [Prevotella sp.]|nr:hypothetical protein [Prevotella sp.]
MKQTKNILRGRPWLLLLTLFAWLLPQQAAASYEDEPANYSISLGGSNIVYIQAPVYDQTGADTWVYDGNLKVSVEGGATTDILHWSTEEDIPDDRTWVNCSFSTTADGFFDITLGNSRTIERLTKSKGRTLALTRNSDGRTFEFSAEWVVPYNLLGKKLKFSWYVKRNGNSATVRNREVPGLKEVTITMPEAAAKLTPFLSTPMLNPKNPGVLELPWFLASDSITKAYYEYDDVFGTHHKEDINNMNSGTIVLDANVPHKDLRVVCNYKVTGDKGVYEIEGVSSSTQNVPLIHAPIGMIARPLGDTKAKVELTWSVPYPDDEDLIPTDFFVIQRSLTGKEEDFYTIAQEFYSKTTKKTTYTFIDSTLVEAIQADMLKNGGTLDNLTYRVRRAISQDWGWGADNNCATSTRCVVDNLHLQRVSDYTAKWEDERAYTVRVSWNYADELGAVWDDRAQMVLRVMSRNKAGEVVDSMMYTLDQNERVQRYKIVNLTRSCVYYDIDMYVEKGESPINFAEQVTSYYFPIRNADDWKEFRNKVQVAEGKYDVNARLYADITTDQLISWESRYAYRGVFDGNGYTITFNLADTGQEFMAPFRYVGNATIRNLRTAGTVNTSARYAAGLIGWTMEGATVNIESCRSSVTLKSSVNGEGLLAGFIARQSGSDVVIRNCKFDGSFEGNNATNNCGFVAWVARGSNLIINNSVFSPDHIVSKFDGCQTWVGLDTQDVKYSNVNSYATREYSAYIVIRNAADWHQFAVMVNNATNRYWVDAVLDADITISEHVGVTDGAYYRGTFNGNGHTITFNKSGWSDPYIAPFRHVGDATIKNLHIAGAISSSSTYAAGFVAQVVNGGNLTIENCHSSVNLNCTASGDMTLGGFVGRVSGGTLNIRNSKFDGSFEGANSYGHGGFVAWVIPNSNVTIQNCLFDPDHINTKLDYCETWARKDADASARVTVTNSHATKYLPCEIREINGQWFMVLKSTTDWGYFVDALKTNPATNAIMDADFGIVTSADNFNGIFDGNGHILNINIDGGSTEAIAIFKNAPGCTIKNLHVTGYIKGGNHLAALVGVAGVANNKWTDIFNCRVSANIVSSDWLVGGFVGRGTHANIQNCLFDGRLECLKAQVDGSQNWAGVFFGFKDGEPGAKVTDAAVSNCVENTTWRNIIHMYTNVSPWRRWGNDENEWTKNNYTYNDLWVAKDCSKMAANDLANKLGSSEWEAKVGASNWIEPGVYVYPIMHTTTIPDNPWLALSTTQQAEALGIDNWEVVNGKVVPIMSTNTIAAVTNEESFLNNLGNGWTMENGVLVPATTTLPEPTSNVFGISTADDWRQFRDLVEAAKGQKDVNAVLLADISTNLSIGWGREIAYRGTFDGNGHTITFNISESDNNIALFRFAKDYTIRNLTLKGSVRGAIHSAGLVGVSDASSGKHNTITNCHVSVTVDCSSTHAGGIIGHGQKAAHTITNCLFDGSIKCSGSGTKAGAIVGWDDGHEGSIISNNLENGSYTVTTVGLNNSYVGGVYGNSAKNTNNWTYHEWSEANQVGSMTTADLAVQLGINAWQVVGDKVVPKMNASSVTKSNVPDFYHKNTGTIDKVLMTQTRQSSVLLSWNTDGSPIDYFKVMRRVQGEGDDAWKEIATNIDQLSYEDTSVSPLVTYEYKVIGVNDCEGISTTETQTKVGESKHTGRLDGYVRFNDGTSAAGIEVNVFYKNNKVATVFTDESGHYIADELSYYGGTTVDYEVSAVHDSGAKFLPERTGVTFDAHSNDESLREIVIQNGKRFSGYVMYDGTSIPVKGANFMVNSKKIHNAKGDFVETEYDGSFSFYVLPGNDTIQVVMDGHTFTNNGYYKSPAGHYFNDNVSNTYFYDATKVKLTGRVVGGDNQGKMPLGNNLSKNNLGDSLTIVLALEGDNTSWLVFDNQNPNRTTREEVVRHQRNGNKHFTTVKTERKRMTVLPDEKTGEYELLLPPVRWKVQQVYCKGYPTLFQEGQVNEVVDLTDCLTAKDTTYVGTYYSVDSVRMVDPTLSYNAIYNRIYHSPVEVTYRQLGYDTFDYFGDRTYTASELTGESVQVPLVYPVKKENWPVTRSDSLKAVYTFGHPVFSVERKYRIQLQVAERYQYNNDPSSGAPDLVRLGGGKARMQNGMKGFALESLMEPPVDIDSLGQAMFTLQANQTATLLSGENALNTVTFTVERDGTFIEAEPLHGYVLNMFPIGEAQDVMTEGAPILYDILRDPPGGYSSNTLAKGATLNNTYMMNLSLSAGLYFSYKSGTQLETITASVATVNTPATSSGSAVGPINGSDSWDAEVDFLMYNAQGSKAFSHSMVVGNNISTSGDPSMVGADADLYIGSVQNVVVTPMSTIRAVNKKMFDEIAGRQGGVNKVSEVAKNVNYGTMVKIAEGKNAKGDTLYLIRDVALGYGPKIQSQFVYSQKQLLTQIIPAKAKEIVDMMYLGTKAEAQKIANKTQRPVYLSLRQPTDTMFAVVNRQLDDRTYNDSIDKAEKGINYLVVIPSNKKHSDFSDEVSEKYQIIKAWVDMIAKNEMEKLQANDLVTNYDVAGAAGVNYSETFDASFSNSMTQHFPVATEVDYFGLGKGASNAISAAGIASTIVAGIAASLAEMKTWQVPNVDGVWNHPDHGEKSTVYFSGKMVEWTLVPVVSYTTIGTDSETKSYNRTESFTIATDPSSHLNVDVYRSRISTDSKNVDVYNIFTNDNFNKYYGMVKDQMVKTLKNEKIVGPRSFVFRTRGGSTQNPWEDQRVTKIYDPGTVLDARTLKICNPKIRLDKQSVSGVSVNDAAHFTVFLSNESEKPEATDNLTVLQLFAADHMNPLGAKISVNGQTLTTAGIPVTVVPGQETALQMEVRAGQGFDFEKLVLGVMSPTDPDNTTVMTSFDVHFLREAGGVNIAVPGDKWVLNTNSQLDSKRGWYIPVTINGFDRHQHNFDHIEFQYKESQRGDDAWTNLCSFYASDSLMANANGVRKLIPENGNIVTEFYGEGWVTERTYDLRAVLFCRNGSDFLTTPSKVISGIKDTRRPQLFGTPEPKSGLLTSGENIIFNFSEDIEHNYLSAITNFEVKGEVNNDNLSEMVSVQFDGKGSLESEAKRNFNGKNLTIDLMVRPNETGRDMPLFSHGTNGQKLQLWLTKDYKLKGVVNEQVFTSDSTIVKKGFTQVAMTVNQTDSLVTFFNGGVQAGKQHKLTSLYTGTGPLIFGRTNELDRKASQYYEGRMMEARLWYSAMDGGLIGTTYGNQRLTGYEKDLVDYYPMNEGSGKYVKDYTQGANAQMIGTSWAIPRGISLHLEKADKGMLLTKDALNRTGEQDYTLMFWFKTDADGRGALLSNGRGLKEDNGAENQFHIGFEGDKLMYRSNGFGIEVPGNWSDNNWHNFAMTVNRGRNVANIYMDMELRTTFELDSLSGISGGYPLIGATRYDVVKENGDVEVVDGTDAMKGNVDELMFFAQALPQQLISTYSSKSPRGDEAGLLTYLGFDRIERQKDNDLEVVPYVYSKRLYLDDKGEPRYQLNPETKEPTDTLVRDYVFVDDVDAVKKHLADGDAAPVVPYEEVKNLKFSFIGKDNQVLVDIDEPAARLNHRNIYVTLRDVEDRNGNSMASPQTACYYVANSSLQWMVNRVDATIKYGASETVDLPFYNNGATAHNYTIDNCPKWITLSKYKDVLAPQTLDGVTATVSKDLNIGTYNEIIYLTDEDGITEPLYLNLTVEGEQPAWAQSINGDLLQHSMSISGQVYLYNELDTDSRDIVGAFDNENVCHGFANITHDVQTGETALYLTVYDKEAEGRELKFRLWQYSTGREIVLTPEKNITFKSQDVLGTDKPVRLDGGNSFVQNFSLNAGWNWVSFNISSKQLEDVNTLLKNMTWTNGDILTDMNSNLTLVYENGEWQVSGTPKNEDGTPKTLTISPKSSYAIKVQKACDFPIDGTVITEKEERTIQLEPGWNGIGYTPTTNLTVETALSDYYDYAEEGDVIKSHTEFAYFSKSGSTGHWRGSLKYMKPGEGYMLLRKGVTNASFTYPFYEPNSNFREDWSDTNRAASSARRTMSVSAVIEGFYPEEGDSLVAYAAGGEKCGMVSATDEVLYMSIGGEAQAGLWFTIERDGEVVAATTGIMDFRADAVVGSPDDPAKISFEPRGNDEGKWYTIGGILLPNRPTAKGVYIHNGKKVVIK